MTFPDIKAMTGDMIATRKQMVMQMHEYLELK